MLLTQQSLLTYNTFKLEASCAAMLQLTSLEQLPTLTTYIQQYSKHLVLGGGSNVVFTHYYDGLVIKNNLKGIQVVSEDDEYIELEVAAGESWHNFVLHCVNNNYGGVENLSLIPGTVGAAPIQNIGAYGVEVKDTITNVAVYNLTTNTQLTFSNEACKFGYRDSIFKQHASNEYIVTAVTFKLNKTPVLKMAYGAIAEQLQSMHISQPTIKNVSDAVIAIRNSKLPNPSITGNAGSFFKNPIVTQQVFERLIVLHPTVLHYADAKGIKLAAGWLIEQCGLKGYMHKGAAVHNKQALVLVNANNAKGTDVVELAQYIQNTVHEKYGVLLEIEVNIL
jgi:UDP-N-acetylmuramate dehydrogenase